MRYGFVIKTIVEAEAWYTLKYISSCLFKGDTFHVNL